jgi:hypothetical protein
MLPFTIVVHEGRKIVGVDDLNMGFHDHDVAFEGLVLNQYGTFDRITKKTIDDQGYAYLYCELFD